MNIKIINSLFFLFLCSTFPSSGSGRTIEIRTVGFPPFGIDKQGEYSGVYYDLANRIVSDAGYKFNNQVIPYARIVKSIKHGLIDLSIMYRYPELEDYVEYIAALPSQIVGVVGLEGTHFNNLSDLAGKKITYIRGAKFNKYIDNDKTIIKY